MNYSNQDVQKMTAYSPPIEGRRKFRGLLLDFNESVNSPSARVKKAMTDFILKDGRFNIYPEYAKTDLAGKIAAYAGVEADEVMVTNGSDQGIELIFRTFTTRNDTVVIPTPSFAMFYQSAGIEGNKVEQPVYRENDLSFPLEEVLEIIATQKPKLIVICNPNNPTGTLLARIDIQKILKAALITKTIVYIDEAYFEFSGVTAAPLIGKYPNLIVTRTFSKAFGLAALRIGYVLACRSTIEELKKVRGPYDVNMMAVTAACAALKELKIVQKYSREVMKKAKPLIEKFFRAKKIPYFQSGSNFILFSPPQGAELVYKKLQTAGFLVRPRKGQNIDSTLRVTIGTLSQMKKFIAAYTRLFYS